MEKEHLEQVATKLLDDYGMNWKVNTQPLYTLKGDHEGVKETEFVTTQREDTGQNFGVFKSGYEVFQNQELAELVYRVAENTGLEVARAGYFNDGGRVFIQLRNEDVKGIGENNDTIQNYTSGINTHDGSGALRWGYGNKVVSCANSFWSAYRSLNNSSRHTVNMKVLVEQALQEVEEIKKVESEMIGTFFMLAETASTELAVRRILKTVIGVDFTKDPEVSTRKINQMEVLTGCINSEMEQKGNTLWGLYNGVTKYTTHHYGSDANREHAKVFGVSNRIDNNSLKQLTGLITA